MTHAEVKRVKAEADSEEMCTNRCVLCTEKVFFVQAEKGYEKGHIYSDLGKKEYGITQICEYCFDEATQEIEDE